jgi:cephalosporin hydroxylase
MAENMRYPEVNTIESFGEFDFYPAYDQWVAEAPAGSTLVEVGNYHGRSLIYLSLIAKKANKRLSVVGVDHGIGMGGGSTKEKLLDNVRKFEVMDILRLVTATSEEGSKLFKDESVWLCFIDDDHTEEGFEKSFKAWFPKVCKGGVVAGHDYIWHTVWETIARLYPQREHGPTSNVWSIKKK